MTSPSLSKLGLIGLSLELGHPLNPEWRTGGPTGLCSTRAGRFSVRRDLPARVEAWVEGGMVIHARVAAREINNRTLTTLLKNRWPASPNRISQPGE
eukprot:4898088-Pyramimonas_sp.AAC.1